MRPTYLNYGIVNRGKLTNYKYVDLEKVIELFHPNHRELDKLLGVDRIDEEKEEETD